MEIVSQIAVEGEGRISFYGDGEKASGCTFHIPLKPIQQDGTFYPSNLHVDNADFHDLLVTELEDLDGREVQFSVPDDDDFHRHGSHYAVNCHNPLDVRKMSYRIDGDFIDAKVQLTIYYNVHGLSPVSEVSLDCRLRLTD